jgi:hypothetical protein
MAGLLTHVVIALIGFIIFSLSFNSWKYGLAFALGHFTPDLLDFGIAGIKQGSLNPSVIMTNPLFQPLALFGHSALNWLIIAFLFIAVMFLLYKFKKIKKSTLVSWCLMTALFILGIAVHLIIDKLVIETSYWI